MVNGNYVLYGDRSSESEIVDDHVHARTIDRKNKRKANRTANELQRTLNLAQLDNDTDSVKCEKKVKEPRLLRYVSTTDVEENFVTEKFETYDLKATEERPRRYTFQKKPKNPTDGSVNYAYSRSSSSCSSPNANLPTISEHGEQYGTYRVRSMPSPKVGEVITGFENKLDKYFSKPKEVKKFRAKVNYKGSHPDSLYRVPTEAGVGEDRLCKTMKMLRWPAALVAVCIALTLFVYFLMPDKIDRRVEVNGTHLQSSKASKSYHPSNHKAENTQTESYGTKTAEIDFYDNENDKFDSFYTSAADTVTETITHRKLPVQPVFPTHITPEVQYGNERADSKKLRTPKILDDDSTVKPHITHKPEKPLAVDFKEANEFPTESINRAETGNDFGNYGEIQTTRKFNERLIKPLGHKEQTTVEAKPLSVKQHPVTEPRTPPEIQVHTSHPADVDFNFTSGHSKLFGISIEDAERMKSTTQSSVYNTRVSPTLPTWRDGDDSTTKKYPVNVNFEVPQCRSTRLALCRGVLPYDLAGSPVTVGGLDVTILLPQMNYLVATNCSDRIRHFACALMEPECNPPPYPVKMPCHNLCKAIVDNCEGLIPQELMPVFDCKRYSRNNCVAARIPCFPRETQCQDGTCIPREWICDGSRDCTTGDDETSCVVCGKDEYRCEAGDGSCIPRRWLCDGYADCPDGQDETYGCDFQLGEEGAGSAPAPAVHRPNRLPTEPRDLHRTGESDNSKELLVTSDSNNALKRNFTRRPSPSRLTPYTRKLHIQNSERHDIRKQERKPEPERNGPTTTQRSQHDSNEDVNVQDLGFFEELKKIASKPEPMPVANKQTSGTPRTATSVPPSPSTRLDKTINKLEKVINGAALLKKAAAEDQPPESLESNSTTIGDYDEPRGLQRAGTSSPCPSGELRCVDGRCITLAQLCDGTIDCTDHADEDNCYT